jgi:predicted RNase H-like HicB family nuclease
MQPIRVELEREEDGRIVVCVPDLPGVMAYGVSVEDAVRKVKAIALASWLT